jgi:hypothetical protein
MAANLFNIGNWTFGWFGREQRTDTNGDYSTVETERLDENGKNGLNFLRLVLIPLLFELDSTMRQFGFGVGLMDIIKPMKRWFQASGDRLKDFSLLFLFSS